MSRLPPYSTYRTDKSHILVPQAISKGNILKFTPRGFNQVLNVKFPDSRLAVCEKCKKNFKTRESCRVRTGHTTAPWTTAYICVTLDDSCTDSEGKFVDKPLTARMSNWQPMCLKHEFDKKAPVCASCKKTNRTRSFCREKHKHRQLPWCTVYVILSAVDATDPTTVVAAPSEKTGMLCESMGTDYKKKAPRNSKEDEGSTMKDDASTNDDTVDGANKSNDKEDDSGDTDNIYNIEQSRTFLSQISCKSNTIHWLDIDGETNVSTNESDVKALNNAIRTPSVPTDMQVYASPQIYHHLLTPQQQHQHYYQQQQQLAAWQAQYGAMGPIQGQVYPLQVSRQQMPNSPESRQESGVDTTTGSGDSGEGNTGIAPLQNNENNAQPDSDFNNLNQVQTSPDSQSQWHAQMMFQQQQMYHHSLVAHQHYMAQQQQQQQQHNVHQQYNALPHQQEQHQYNSQDPNSSSQLSTQGMVETNDKVRVGGDVMAGEGGSSSSTNDGNGFDPSNNHEQSSNDDLERDTKRQKVDAADALINPTRKDEPDSIDVTLTHDV